MNRSISVSGSQITTNDLAAGQPKTSRPPVGSKSIGPVTTDQLDNRCIALTETPTPSAPDRSGCVARQAGSRPPDPGQRDRIGQPDRLLGPGGRTGIDSTAWNTRGSRQAGFAASRVRGKPGSRQAGFAASRVRGKPGSRFACRRLIRSGRRFSWLGRCCSQAKGPVIGNQSALGWLAGFAAYRQSANGQQPAGDDGRGGRGRRLAVGRLAVGKRLVIGRRAEVVSWLRLVSSRSVGRRGRPRPCPWLPAPGSWCRVPGLSLRDRSVSRSRR
jgi:hypothetical protein